MRNRPPRMGFNIFTKASVKSILGGYMVFFNLLFILPVLAAGIFSLSERTAMLFTGGVSCLLEITGGIDLVGNPNTGGGENLNLDLL